MSVLTTAQLQGTVEPVVRKFAGLNKKNMEADRKFDKIFNVETGGEAVRHIMEFGGPGQLQLKQENAGVQGLNITQGVDQTNVWSLYAGKIQLSMELVRDTKYKAIKTVAGAMGRSMALTPEYLAAQFVNNAFAGTFGSVAFDGVAVLSSAHRIVGTNATNGTNILTTPAALSETSTEDLLVQMMTTLGPDGMIVPIQPDQFVVPAALMHVAHKISRTEQTLGSANNDPSVTNRKITGMKEPIIFQYLDAGSTTNWHILSDWRQNGLYWEWDIKEEFFRDTAPTILQEIYVAIMRLRYGCDDWRGIFGSNPT